ncbi:hypothetical protein D3C75_652970 [compost metagenome]
MPLPFSGGSDEHLLAASKGEHVIDGPGADAIGHRRCSLAGDDVLLHVLGREQDAVLVQGALHLAAGASGVALVERSQHANGTEHATHDVVHRAARAQRAAHWPGHVRQAGHHLHHLVQRQAVVVRAAEEAFVRGIDQPRVALAQRCVVQAQLVHTPRLEVLDEHVGGVDQLQHGVAAFRRFDIDGDALLVAVEGAEEARPRAQQAARAVTAQGFDLDHFGAKVTEDHAAGRPHDHVRNLDDTDAVQGKSGHRATPRSSRSGVAGSAREVQRQSGAGDAAVQGLARQRFAQQPA